MLKHTLLFSVLFSSVVSSGVLLPAAAQERSFGGFAFIAEQEHIKDFSACRISHPDTDDKENAVLLLTRMHQPTVPFRVPFAAQFRNDKSWYALAENGAEIPVGLICNVFFVMPSDGPTAPVRPVEGFVHRGTRDNTTALGTTLDHFSCHGKPNAVVLVTERPSTGMSNWPSVSFQGADWQIATRRNDTKFNVVVCPPGKTDLGSYGEMEAFIHTVTSENLEQNLGRSILQRPDGTHLQDPFSFVFVTAHQREANDALPERSSLGGNGSWCLFDKDLKEGQKFSVLVVTRLTR